MDTHLSIAFVTGSLFESAAGIEIYPMQKTFYGKEFWYPEKNSTADYKDWELNEILLSEEVKDVALVLEISHPIVNEVEEYLEDKELEISKIINCSLGEDIGLDAIKDGTHALKLASSLSVILKEGRDTQEKRNKLHIFAACPNGFMFYLGKFSKFFGKMILYEYDREHTHEELYLPSFELPIKR